MKKILIAGIGNIFHGDDAFGCELVRHLRPGDLPGGVAAKDFGISSYDLAYALTDDYDAIILLDAASRGQEPGTLYLIEPSLNGLSGSPELAVDAHSMNPVAVIQMAQTMGGVKGKLYLLGCEPEVLESEQGEMGLSRRVQEAIPEALRMLNQLTTELLNQNEKQNAGLLPA